MMTTATRKFTLIALAASMAFAMGSCKKKKEVTEPKVAGEVLINEYCTGEEYRSSKDTFRSSATGESLDSETATKKARSNAMAELAKSISATMQIVGDNYVNSTEFNNKEEVTETFNEMARTVIDQELKGAVVICTKLTKTPEGKNKRYLALELSSGDLLNAYNERLSNDEKIKADYNYEKFKETFEKEMEKMGN